MVWGCGLDWTELKWTELGDEESTASSSCERENDPSGFKKGDEFLGSLYEWLRCGLTSACYNQLCSLTNRLLLRSHEITFSWCSLVRCVNLNSHLINCKLRLLGSRLKWLEMCSIHSTLLTWCKEDTMGCHISYIIHDKWKHIIGRKTRYLKYLS